MKRTKQNSKLKLGKEVVSSLNKKEQNHLQGGKAAWTTSIDACSGFACCNPTSITDTYSAIFKCIEANPQ